MPGRGGRRRSRRKNHQKGFLPDRSYARMSGETLARSGKSCYDCVMRQRLEVVIAVLVVIILLAALVWAVPRWLTPLPATPPVTPSLTTAPTNPAVTGPRAIIVSLAGMRPDLLEKYLQQGDMPHLARLIANGARAEYAQTIYPALTAPAHAAIACSAYADATGVVADVFHVPGTSLEETWRGQDTITPVEPVWATATRQGHRTATICWPGSNPGVPTHAADLVIGPGIRDVESNLHQLHFTRVITATTAWTGLPVSFSPWLESAFPIIEAGEKKYPVYALLVDTTDDGRENYDTLLLDMDQAINERTPRGRLDEWIALETDPHVHGGAYFKVSSADLGDFRIYQSDICYNSAAPTELLRALNAQVGFFPTDPDRQALERGWISAADYLTMLDRQGQWIIDATLYLDSIYHPELFFVWLGGPAAAQEQFLLVETQQAGYSPARAREYEGYIRQAYRLTDRHLGRLLTATDLETTTVFVVSDRGTAPIHTAVHVNQVLVNQGLLVLEPGTWRVDVGQTEAYAVVSGGTVHIYVNSKLVAAGSHDLVRESVIAALQDVRGATGAPVFPLILRREEADRIHLNHPHSGDVIAVAAPGYLPSADLRQTQVFGPVTTLGQAGYEPLQPTMHAIFIVGGRGIRPGVQLAPLSLLDVTPTVARLLGLQPATHWQGQVLVNILQR